jgi:hypothetical protein
LDGGRGILEDLHRPPLRLREPPAPAPWPALLDPRELLLGSLPAILYDAEV